MFGVAFRVELREAPPLVVTDREAAGEPGGTVRSDIWNLVIGASALWDTRDACHESADLSGLEIQRRWSAAVDGRRRLPRRDTQQASLASGRTARIRGIRRTVPRRRHVLDHRTGLACARRHVEDRWGAARASACESAVARMWLAGAVHVRGHRQPREPAGRRRSMLAATDDPRSQYLAAGGREGRHRAAQPRAQRGRVTAAASGGLERARQLAIVSGRPGVRRGRRPELAGPLGCQDGRAHPLADAHSGLAHSSPIVWGDRVFVTSAISQRANATFKPGLYGDGDASDDRSSHRWMIYALDKRTGRVIWERVAHEGEPLNKRHIKSTYASATPATDGRLVVAWFGSQGVHAYDVNGNFRWKVDLGRVDMGAYDIPTFEWGPASSPILWNGLVILQCDTQADSFLLALDAETGKTVWKTDRQELPSWARRPSSRRRAVPSS